MDWDSLYADTDRERWVPESVKRVDAPERTAFERDRARVVHSASLRRLAAKTQVVGPDSDDFVRNRLTHSLEVAQVARDIAHPLGCHPDLTETAALAHDLGHPPFGHNGETALDRLAERIGGFEGNAQTLRILTRLEAKSATEERSIGLNLTRATLDACTKYPWTRPEGGGKFGVYDEDLDVFDWLRADVAGGRRCVEAQVMDFADDVAYSVHDLEDGIVAGEIDLARLDIPEERAAVWQTVQDWYLPEATDAALDDALERVSAVDGWSTAPYDGSRRALAGLKNLTSDMIGIFCGSVHRATWAKFGEEPLLRYRGELVVPMETTLEIGVLKGIAAHYVMQSPHARSLHERQRALLAELHDAVLAGAPDTLDPVFRADFRAARDDAAAQRVVIDQLASLTDASALAWHSRLGSA